MRLKDREKREAIKQATLALVAEQGVAGLKMASLARRTGLSPSTLYVYFEDKEDLIVSLFREVTRQIVHLVLGEYDPSLPYKASFKKVILKYLKCRIDIYQEHLFLEQVKTSPYYQKIIAEVKGDELEGAMVLLEAGKEQMLFKDLPAPLLFAALDGMIEKMSNLFICGELENNQTNLDHCFDLIWDSLQA